MDYKPTPSLNPTAASFSFSPGASSFTPSFAPQAAAAAPPPPPCSFCSAITSPAGPRAASTRSPRPSGTRACSAAQQRSGRWRPASSRAEAGAGRTGTRSGWVPAAGFGRGFGRVQHRSLLHDACLPCCTSAAKGLAASTEQRRRSSPLLRLLTCFRRPQTACLPPPAACSCRGCHQGGQEDERGCGCAGGSGGRR